VNFLIWPSIENISVMSVLTIYVAASSGFPVRLTLGVLIAFVGMLALLAADYVARQFLQ